MSKEKSSAFLDVDPSIIENKLLFTDAASALDDEFKNLFNSPEVAKTVKPFPGFCLKSHDKNNNQKVFVNICQSDDMPAPADISEEELTKILNSDEPSSYRVPLSIGEPHMEKDNSGKPAKVYDVLINSSFLKKIEKSPTFNLFFITLIFEGLTDKFQIDLDIEKYVILKNKKSMGALQYHAIQKRDSEKCKVTTPLIQEVSSKENQPTESKPQKKNTTSSSSNVNNNNNANGSRRQTREMPYHIIREPAKGRVKYLIGEFKIDRTLSERDISLDVGEDRIIVCTGITNEMVDIFVPYTIKPETAKAVLNQNTSILTVTMVASDPIIPTGNK